MTLTTISRQVPIARPVLDVREVAAVLEVFRSGTIAEGPRVRAFEEAFARYIGVEEAVAVSSGTAALHLALMAHGVGPGDEVITTPFSFIATANSILYVGARPVFVDVGDDFNIDPNAIESMITPRTKAIIPVHLYGQNAEMDAITDIAAERDLAVIEDACQAHGAKYKGKMAGSFGTGCFSFYPTKNMTTGEGGMITTDNPEVADSARLIRNHGMRERYNHETLGYNLRMTDIAAAIGLVQLERLDRMNELRRRNARILTRGLRDIEGVITPYELPGRLHVYHQYTVRISGNRRDGLVRGLTKRGVGTGIYYPRPIHKQPLYSEMGYETYPMAERLAEEVVSLPVHPALGDDDLGYVIESIGVIL